jgi:hypothetical protein
MTLIKAIQLEFGRRPLSAFQKTGRNITTAVRKTRMEEAIEKSAEAGKGAAVKAIRVKAVKAIKAVKPRKALAKEKAAEVEVESKGNNNSNKIEKSEVIYIREETPITKRNKRLAKKI